jgi:hypothetical protein
LKSTVFAKSNRALEIHNLVGLGVMVNKVSKVSKVGKVNLVNMVGVGYMVFVGVKNRAFC